MLNFFRKLRRLPAAGRKEMKSTRYLKYAIGETFLVMIGILLALAINNWNNGRLQKKNARNHMVSMVEDLENDILQYQTILASYRDHIRKKSQLFLNAEYQSHPIDSLFEYVTSYYNADRLTDRTYQKTQNSGNSDLLGTLQISEAINNYYSITSAQFKELLTFDREWSNTDNTFWLNNELYEAYGITPSAKNLPFMASESTRKQGLISLINSVVGRNKLRFAISRKEIGVSTTEKSISEAAELIQLIQTELEK